MELFRRVNEGDEWEAFNAAGIVDAILRQCDPYRTPKHYKQISNGKEVIAYVKDGQWTFPNRDARIAFYTHNSVIYPSKRQGFHRIYIAYPIKDDFKAAIPQRKWLGANGFAPNWEFPEKYFGLVQNFIKKDRY